MEQQQAETDALLRLLQPPGGLIPVDSELSVFLYKLANLLKKIHVEIDRLSESVLVILVRGFQISGIFSWIADSATLPPESQAEAKALRDQLKVYLKLCINIVDDFLAFAEGRRSILTPQMIAVLPPLLSMLSHPRVVRDTGSPPPPLPPPLSPQPSQVQQKSGPPQQQVVTPIKQTTVDSAGAIAAVRQAKQTAEQARQSIAQMSEAEKATRREKGVAIAVENKLKKEAAEREKKQKQLQQEAAAAAAKAQKLKEKALADAQAKAAARNAIATPKPNVQAAKAKSTPPATSGMKKKK